MKRLATMFNNKRNASHGNGRVMSDLPLKADMCGASSDVGYGPEGLLRNVRFGSKVDMTVCRNDVRSYAESGHHT